MRDIGERRLGAPKQEKIDDLWWFKGLLFVAAVAMTVAHFGLQRSFALERAAVGDRHELEQISEEDRAGLAAIIAGSE